MEHCLLLGQFKEHRDILASNTGIVSTSSLLSVFPHHNTDMLVGFLQSLNFCQPVEPSVLENTNQTLVLPAGQGYLVAPTEQDQGRRGDQLWSERVWSGGWCSLVLRAQLVGRNSATEENRQACLCCGEGIH